MIFVLNLAVQKLKEKFVLSECNNLEGFLYKIKIGNVYECRKSYNKNEYIYS